MTRPQTRRVRQLTRKAGLGLLFILPWLLGLVLLRVLPLATSFAISFTTFNPIRPSSATFVGLHNYLKALQDSGALAALWSTATLVVVMVPCQVLAALGLAALLHSPYLAGRRLLRVLFFIPSIIPGTAITVIALGLADPSAGWLHKLFLVEPAAWSNFGYVVLSVLLTFWAIGPSFLILLGAMQGVPPDLYEAAVVDGAGLFQRFVSVTVPLISPAIFFCIIIHLVTLFGGAAILDQGTQFSEGISAFDNFIAQVMFDRLDYGYAASLAWVLFAFVITVVLILFGTAPLWVHYADAEQ